MATSKIEYKKLYHISAHEYVMIEYFRQFKTEHMEEILKKHHHEFVDKTGNVNYDLLARFILKNLKDFYDEKLLDDVLKRAIILFSLNYTLSELNPFSKENLEKYFDIDHRFGGINILNFNIETTINEYKSLIFPDLIKKFLYEHEIKHFKHFLTLETNSEMLEYVEEGLTKMKNSGTYRYVLEFGRNALWFYLSDDFPLEDTKLRGTWGNIGKADIVGGVLGGMLGGGVIPGAVISSLGQSIIEVIDKLI